MSKEIVKYSRGVILEYGNFIIQSPNFWVHHILCWSQSLIICLNISYFVSQNFFSLLLANKFRKNKKLKYEEFSCLSCLWSTRASLSLFMLDSRSRFWRRRSVFFASTFSFSELRLSQIRLSSLWSSNFVSHWRSLRYVSLQALLA